MENDDKQSIITKERCYTRAITTIPVPAVVIATERTSISVTLGSTALQPVSSFRFLLGFYRTGGEYSVIRRYSLRPVRDVDEATRGVNATDRGGHLSDTPC